MKDKRKGRDEAGCGTDGRVQSLTRRQFVAAAGAGLVATGLPLLMAARKAAAAESSATAPPDLAAARKEGPL